MNDYICRTKVKCNDETVDVVRDFVTDHMGRFICPLDASMEEISQYQIEIRGLIEPYMKKRLPYLRQKKFSNPEFYSLFILMIVIDQVNEYDWEHVNSLVYFKYNEDGMDSYNQYGLVMRDDYFDLEEYNDDSELSQVNCCCSKPHISSRTTTKIHNGKYTFNLGSHCILKTSIAYYKDKDSKVKRYDRQKTKEKKRLEREEEERLRREEEERLERQRLQRQGRMFCIGEDCGKLLPEGQPKWRVRCNRCYAIFMSENN